MGAYRSEFYKERYKAASKGNYDIYVVFVERGLSLLNQNGRLGFILPHKFFNAKYGEPVREFLSQGNHLSKIVHFGDQQVFSGATTYTCLMFLDKTENDKFEFEKVEDLEKWRSHSPETSSVGGEISTEIATSAEWNFIVGPGSKLFEKLSQMPVKLGDVAERMAQGIRTSANDIYVVNLITHEGDFSVAYSKQLDKNVTLDNETLSSFLQGREIKRYQILSSGKMVIIPYRIKDHNVFFNNANYMQEKFSHTFAYLRENKKFLENREKGKMRGENWYAYVYPKNIELMKQSKILIPDIADRAQFALDENGEFAFTSGYGVTIKASSQLSQKYVLGLLNSKLLEFFLKKISTPMQNGFFRFFTQFIERLPIHPINFSDPIERAQHDKMVALVESMLELHKRQASAGTPREKEMLSRRIAATDEAIDQLVYELYGLTEEEIRIVEG